MRSSVQRIFAATLLACLLVSSSAAPRAQDSRQTVTRPRRATAAEWPTPTPDDATAVETTPVEAEPVRITSEPLVRVGLATDARSVTVSTTGRLLNATETDAPPAPLEVARVRIEPRTPPPPAKGPPPAWRRPPPRRSPCRRLHNRKTQKASRRLRHQPTMRRKAT